MGNIVDHFSSPFVSESNLCGFSVYFGYLEFCHLWTVPYDTFSFHRFRVKLDDGIPLSVLLLLSGDVELHPGPSVEHPCNVCALEVDDSDKALCCDICRDQWVHVACDPGVEESTYDDMVANPTSALWYCSKCSDFEPTRNVFV